MLATLINLPLTNIHNHPTNFSQTPRDCHYAVFRARVELGVRGVENLPAHETMRSPVNMFGVERPAPKEVDD